MLRQDYSAPEKVILQGRNAQTGLLVGRKSNPAGRKCSDRITQLQEKSSCTEKMLRQDDSEWQEKSDAQIQNQWGLISRGQRS